MTGHISCLKLGRSNCPTFRQLAKFRQNDAGACVTEWPTNEREDLAHAIFIRLKRSEPGIQKTIVDVWQRGCTATATPTVIKALVQTLLMKVPKNGGLARRFGAPTLQMTLRKALSQ